MNQPDIAAGLRALGVRPGMMLEVHSALSAFGHVEGGADTLIEALMEVVGKDGAIVMPSFTISTALPLTDEDKRLGLTLKIKILDEKDRHTDNGLGIIAKTFRDRADTVTGQGMFRVSAWGKDAGLHAASGFGRVIDGGGYALLLGVDIYRLSAMHYVEDVLPKEIRRKFMPGEEARAKYPENRWMIEAWSPEGRPWYKIQEAAYQAGLVRDGVIGAAKCMLLQVKPVIELYRKALLENPLELYGLTEMG
ncbi:MAG: AAC(3) family N-acetyltransferase [Firmicutes bacterium]|nr:AAC(3) family N-acetyltransferase [Bacillota bacterium]